jgi:hypothetical protein
MATSPLSAVVDTILLSIHDMQTLYDNLLRLQYPWTGRVINIKLNKTLFESH